MPTQVTLDPTSPMFDSADLAASALADKFGGDKKAALETAGVILHGPDGKYRYSTSVGGRDDSFELAAQIPKGHTMAAIVHTHPGKDVAGQVFSPNDLKMAEQLKLPSYVRFLNDGSTRMYQPGKTATQMMSSGRFNIKVAKGDPLEPSAVTKMADTLDYTDKYNTQLSPEDEQAYQKWAGALGPQGSTYDYDLRGAYKAGAAQSANGHFTDQFKKPNHPTFSDQSQYSGVDGQQGGAWAKLPDGSWSFTPTATMLKLHSPEDLQQYWQRVEPTNKLILPQAQYKPPNTGLMGQNTPAPISGLLGAIAPTSGLLAQ